MISLSYTIAEQEYKDFYYYVGWLAPDRKSFRTKYYLKSSIIYFAVYALFFFINRDARLTGITIIIPLLIAFGLYFYIRYSVKKHYYNFGKKIFQDSDKENTEMIIGEIGILVKDKTVEATYKWSAFVRKYESKDAYYLYMSNIALIIPKRVFKSNSEKDSFDEMLARHFPLQAQLPTIGK